MTVRTKLDIDWSEDAVERAKQYAAKLIIELQCLGYGVVGVPDYSKTFRHAIEFRGVRLGEMYCGTKASKRVGYERDGVVSFSWRRRAGAHDIVLSEGAGDWNYLERLTKTVDRLDESLQKVLISVQHQQEYDAFEATVEAAEENKLEEVKAELEAVTTERDAARRALSLANAKIEQLTQELETVRREGTTMQETLSYLRQNRDQAFKARDVAQAEVKNMLDQTRTVTELRRGMSDVSDVLVATERTGAKLARDNSKLRNDMEILERRERLALERAQADKSARQGLERAVRADSIRIEQLIQELEAVRRERDELLRWEKLRETITQAREAELDATVERKAFFDG